MFNNICGFGGMTLKFEHDVVVVNLASRPPQFLGSASSAPEGLGNQIGANLVRD